ncbi:MAG TPA: Abi-alpha family protein [Pseudonocardiaceae bacterium]|nr:Abi-alpha family protein [Pseudonocardiaceae bacterium]
MPDGEKPQAQEWAERVGHAAGWLARAGWRVTQAVPGGAAAQRRMLEWEDAVTTEVRRRREHIGDTPGFPWRPVIDTTSGERRMVTVVRATNGHLEPLRAGMAELLNRSAHSDSDAGRVYLYTAILRQLVPDEARILAELTDDQPRPLVNIAVRGPLGGVRRMVLEDASTVGRDAGLAVPDYVPFYVGRLHRFGLVDIGEEDPDLADQYAILTNESVVKSAERAARRAWRVPPRTIRRTLVISELGKRFWAACDPTISGPRQLTQ